MHSTDLSRHAWIALRHDVILASGATRAAAAAAAAMDIFGAVLA